jgi:hypothetical protein
MPPRRRLVPAAGPFLQLLHHLVDAKATRLLPRRELLEALEPPRDVSLRGDQDIDVLDPLFRS